MIRKVWQAGAPSRATESQKIMDTWTDAALGVGRSHQSSGPRTPLYSAKAMEDAETAAAPARVVPPPPPQRRRRTRPVTFICMQSPGLALGLPSGGLHVFEDGRLTLTDSRDITAMRHHGWYGNRIFEDTPEVRAQLEARAVLDRQVRRHQQGLADDAQANRRMQGPRGSFGPDPDAELARFPVRRR